MVSNKNGISKKYLLPTEFIESDSDIVIEFAKKAVNKEAVNKEAVNKEAVNKNSSTNSDEIFKASGKFDYEDIRKSMELFYAVRDGIRYDPYNVDLSLKGLRASATIEREKGFCIAKAILLAASSRAVGIPARLAFADIRNHLIPEKLRKVMKVNVFYFHGYTELFVNGKWVKATPTFNRSLCEKNGLMSQEFDGKKDSMLHKKDKNGNLHMEYLNYHGNFPDLPYELMMSTFKDNYPHFFTKGHFSMDLE